MSVPGSMNGAHRDPQQGSQQHKPTQKDVKVDLARLAAKVEATKTNLCSRSGDLLGTLNELDNVHAKMEGNAAVKPREYAADAKIYGNISECLYAAAKGLNANQVGRSMADLCVALKASYVHRPDAQQEGSDDPTAMCWGELRAQLAAMFRLAPGLSCMLGPLDARPKERKAAQRRGRQALEPVTRPEERAQIDEHDKQETDKNMEAMWGIINLHKVVPWAELVCNHQSYAQTVENAFTLSFLVRDNRVSLEHEAARGMLVHAKGSVKGVRGGGKEQEATAGGVEASQFVMKLDQGDWCLMKRVVQPADCLMPHRAVQAHDGDAPQPQPRAAAAAAPAQRARAGGANQPAAAAVGASPAAAGTSAAAAGTSGGGGGAGRASGGAGPSQTRQQQQQQQQPKVKLERQAAVEEEEEEEDDEFVSAEESVGDDDDDEEEEGDDGGGGGGGGGRSRGRAAGGRASGPASKRRKS